MSIEQLRAFIEQSNRIEGIEQKVGPAEREAYERFLGRPSITIPDILALASEIPGDRPCALRNEPGMDVSVGNHVPTRGGPHVEVALKSLLKLMNDSTLSPTMAYAMHVDYETLHPLMDGNGRTGRALFLWAEQRARRDIMLRRPLGFLHEWYYRSLQAARR